MDIYDKFLIQVKQAESVFLAHLFKGFSVSYPTTSSLQLFQGIDLSKFGILWCIYRAWIRLNWSKCQVKVIQLIELCPTSHSLPNSTHVFYIVLNSYSMKQNEEGVYLAHLLKKYDALWSSYLRCCKWIYFFLKVCSSEII